MVARVARLSSVCHQNGCIFEERLGGGFAPQDFQDYYLEARGTIALVTPIGRGEVRYER